MAPRPPLTSPTTKLVSASNDSMAVVGAFTATMECSRHERSVSQPVFVVPQLEFPLLSCQASLKLGIVQLLASVGTPASCTTTHQPSLSSPTAEVAGVESKFADVFTGLGNLSESCHIKLRADAKPHAIYTPRNVPLPLRAAVKTELERMEHLGVIRKVSEPTEWCAPMVVVPKKNGSARICVDLRHLNDSVQRELHQMPTVDEVLGQVSGAQVFSKLDANSGFWQVPLGPDSQLLTTFITPFGRYCFQKIPFGITSAPDIFQKRMSEILDGLDGVVCLIDDMLIFGATQDEHDRRLHSVLSRLQAANVTLNRDKCVFSVTSIDFLGVRLSPSGIQPDDSKIKALMAIPAPTGIPGLRRFLGMANQLGKFSPHLAELSKSLCELLSARNAWHWDLPQQTAFEAIKAELSKPTVLKLYNPHHSTKLCSDASGAGLGAVLYQHAPSEPDWRPVAYASRSLTPTEQRYATIEKEALGVTWACDPFSAYLYGMPRFMIETDHTPLVPLLSTKNMYDLPPRILRFRLRLARYSYSICHTPGKSIPAADALSRAPLPESGPGDLSLEESAEAFVQAAVLAIPPAISLDEIAQTQASDPVCQQLMNLVTTDQWPDTVNDLPPPLKPFRAVRGELTVANKMLLRGHRLVIPSAQQATVIQQLHHGHLGIARCRQRAAETVWWPKLSTQLTTLVQQCSTCRKESPLPTPPLHQSTLPDRPWQVLGADLCELKGRQYLVLVDYFSRYPEVIELASLSSPAIILHLQSVFARWGIPETLRSDNGPQFSSQDFRQFAITFGFSHTTSSPHFPRSNGAAERCVQTVKAMLKKAISKQELYASLLAYRSTPLPWCGVSPAELLLGRCLRTIIPQAASQLAPQWPNLFLFRRKDTAMKESVKSNYDLRHRAKPLSELPAGCPVWVDQNGTRCPAIVKGRAHTPDSYIVTIGNREFRRTRCQLIRQP